MRCECESRKCENVKCEGVTVWDVIGTMYGSVRCTFVYVRVRSEV